MKGYFHKKYINVLLAVFGSLILQTINAQICTPDIFFKHYDGNAAVYTSKVITTTQGDILSVGGVLKINGEFVDATDGWLTKLSPRGTVLWSKRYFVPGFNSGSFISVENATDSSYLVTARFGKYKKRFDGTLEELDAASFLIHIDKFGNVLWVKRMNNYVNDSILSSITRLQDNSFIIAGSIIKSSIPKLLLLNFNLNGTVWWDKILYVDSAQLGTPLVKQLSNGTVIIAGATLKYNSTFSFFTDMGWYIHKIDPVTGSFIRSSGLYINAPTDRSVPLESISNILELPNDTLALSTSYSGLNFFGIDPGSREAMILKTSSSGQFYSADGYLNTVPGCRLMDAQYINGKFRLLVDDGFKTLYAELNRAGDITSQMAYGNVYSLIQGYKLLDGEPSIRSFYTGRRQYPLIGLMKAEPDGSINCMQTPSQLIKDPITSTYRTEGVTVDYIRPSFPFVFEDIGQSVSWANYNFNTNIDCVVTCCDNIRSDTTQTQLCNSLSYRLPDNSVVRETGMYYVNVKNANNCDSIAYYDIQFLKKPVINLGEDTCFVNTAPIVLRADSGYTSYNWMGTDISDHTYTATTPGKYTLSITNRCGTGVDEIIIYEDCEFPVYMPTGFTPGNDGLNDYYNYPIQNKNRLISLDIYNRFGQRVFFTTDRSKGWNGKLSNMEQATGLYVYILRVETLDGRPLVKKGSFVLIR
ncbi:MAG: T9SS type B sorting domain-containing protein [Bacteroidetes bacterium]|nr:MAG: T9SS type B sorting domain-containing protein [Bacteroidota bacterium]